MSYDKTKVYSDGSHFIGIPHEEHPERKRRRTAVSEDSSNQTQKEAFEELYSKSKSARLQDKCDEITREIEPHFESKEAAKGFVQENIERKKRNLIVKQVRLLRKAYLHEWTYFATFTYDSNKHSEDSFRKSLRNCLKHFANRKGWKYIGVWERSPKTERLHFHALVYIPEGTMPGEIVETCDYDTIEHRKQITYQNTFFNKRFGRSDFETLCPLTLPRAISYLMKYLTKSNEKIVYSKNLPTYFVSDVLENDVMCRIGIEDRKLVLADNFTCIIDGEIIGDASPDVIAKMPKAN